MIATKLIPAQKSKSYDPICKEESKIRPRKLKINVSLGGMKLPIATVTIKNFAKLLEAKTELVCPKCNRKPTLY
jgi:hypothetical protein